MNHQEITPDILRFIRYLSFKCDSLREQEANALTLDVGKAQDHYDSLTKEIEKKRDQLKEVMPKRPVTAVRTKPKRPFKQDGSYSEAGKRWFSLLKKQGLPEDTEAPVTEVVGYEEGNPQSDPQIKDWLFSIGWKPDHWKFQRNKITGDEKKIPQVRYSSLGDPRKGQLTDSVVKLIEKEPKLELLQGLTVAQHRASIFKSFLDSAKDGKAVASAGGFTNTLRFKHRKPFVNLPGVSAEWGKEIRGCIVAPKGQVVCGSDVSSLESSTKRHFMWPYDPEYVNEMSKEGFDEHLDLSVHAGAVTPEQVKSYKRGEAPELKHIRTKFKQTNYSAVYGIGAPKLARELDITKQEAQALLDAYWKRNWSVNKVASSQYVKTLRDGSMWLKNPISGFYYSLRNDRDKFSTLNQGSGVFIFDCWLLHMRRAGLKVSLQMHDEVLLYVEKGQEEETKRVIEESMEKVNKSLKLNVTVGVDVQFGESYAGVH